MSILLFAVFFSIVFLNGVYAENGDINLTQSDDNFDTIQSMIDSANPGDSIYLKDKTYHGNGSAITINKNINIYGSDSSETVLDACDKSNILVISRNANVNIVGLTFTNGRTLGDGAAIDNDGKLSIINSTVVNNYAESGAVHNSENGELNVYNSLFNNNTASFGAAIDDYGGDLKIENSTFLNNNALEGGAIYKRFGNFLIYGSIFTNNSAARGGGVYNNRGLLKIYNSQFYFNYASDLGGGIKSWGYCEAYDSIVQNNTGDCGGGFFISEFLLTIENCTIDNNTARKGGGVYVEAKAGLTVSNSVITNNSAYRGGGIDLNQGYLSLSDSTVTNNVADTNGGGIYCAIFSSEIKNSIINNNSAKNGGGIYVNDIPLTVKMTVLNYNSAENGGGIYNTGSLSLTDVDLEVNSANNNGGAVYNTDSLTLSNSTVNKNYAPVNGGGIYNAGSLSLTDVDLETNKAGGNGGAAYNEGDLDIVDSTFKSNEAMFGGAIYTNSLLGVKNSEFSSNSASRAAGIYSNSNLEIDNCQFINNKVMHNSGVLYLLKDNVRITDSLFKLNTGADEGGCIFINKNADVYINSTKFISNDAKSYGAAIDNSGILTIENSLFDDNEAYGAGAIDNGGNLTINHSNFTNNRATNNGGAIDNKGNLNIVSSVFENNVANEDGGAIIARRGINVSYSSFNNNYDKIGYAIFNNTWDSINVSNNWWGSNNPKFEKLFNFNTSDDFTWIAMNVSNGTKLIQDKDAKIVIAFEGVNKNNSRFKIIVPESLPIFKVEVSNGNMLSVENGYLSDYIKIPSEKIIVFKLNDESISWNVDSNPSTIKRIINNKNVVVDYNGKATFKVRVIGDNGKPVGKGVVISMKVGKSIYKVKTNAYGYAFKTFSFTPGKYVIATSYKGYSVKNTITIKKVLKANSAVRKKAKSIKYSASLKTSKGKAIAGTVIFKIKGKTYVAKTNKKGVATIALKNFNVGKYSVVVKYLKSQVKTTLIVKR